MRRDAAALQEAVRAAVANGVSSFASGRACISARLSGRAEKVNVSLFVPIVLPTERAASFAVFSATFLSLSKILIFICFLSIEFLFLMQCRRISPHPCRGPRPLNGQDISFLNDRFRDGKTYLPFTYFAGSTPDNNYTPAQPYKVTIESNHVSAEEQGYMKLFIPCGGADSPRPIKLRQRGSDGKWFLWEQYLLTGVRTPKEADPWA